VKADRQFYNSMSRLFRSLSNAFWCLTTAEGIHYASTLSCMPSTKGIPLRLLSIHRSLSLAIVRSLATHQDKPHVSAISRMPSAIPYATFLNLTHKGIPYASALSRMPSGVSRQLKLYPMRPFCIHSLSHAVRCLATATLFVRALTHAVRCACDRQRRTLRAHQAPVWPP
jgi:hypothetical protein